MTSFEQVLGNSVKEKLPFNGRNLGKNQAQGGCYDGLGCLTKVLDQNVIKKEKEKRYFKNLPRACLKLTHWTSLTN